MFSHEISEIFKNIFFTEHFQWLLPTVSSFQLETLCKRDFGKDVFWEVCKSFKSIFWQNTSV